jgi:hypothetical protein
MVRRDTNGARPREVAVGMAVAALEKRHQDERCENESAREPDRVMAQSLHRMTVRITAVSEPVNRRTR